MQTVSLSARQRRIARRCYSLPVFLDGIGQVGGRGAQAVAQFEQRRVALDERRQIVALVRADARLRVPPVVAAAPRHLCRKRQNNSIVFGLVFFLFVCFFFPHFCIDIAPQAGAGPFRWVVTPRPAGGEGSRFGSWLHPGWGHDPSILDEKKKNIEKLGAGVPNRWVVTPTGVVSGVALFLLRRGNPLGKMRGSRPKHWEPGI